uniref:Uncharacterized protein n=1 Tax=Plectus sambesii TaxID=2011161 RepID=A0A914W9W4_9BILA
MMKRWDKGTGRGNKIIKSNGSFRNRRWLGNGAFFGLPASALCQLELGQSAIRRAPECGRRLVSAQASSSSSSSGEKTQPTSTRSADSQKKTANTRLGRPSRFAEGAEDGAGVEEARGAYFRAAAPGKTRARSSAASSR